MKKADLIALSLERCAFIKKAYSKNEQYLKPVMIWRESTTIAVPLNIKVFPVEASLIGAK